MPLDMQPITTDKPTAEAKLDESKENTDENVFLAFARVFSGRLKHGQKIYVLGPRHDPAMFVGKVSQATCTSRSIDFDIVVYSLGSDSRVCS